MPILVLAGALALAAVLAEAFVFTSLDHDCCGESCPVCAQVDAARRLLEGLTRLGAAALAAGLFAAPAPPLVRLAEMFLPSCLSPVSLKTKITS